MARLISRRNLLKTIAATGALHAARGGAVETSVVPVQAGPPSDATILPLTSTSDVFIPPRGRGFQKFSFDFPEPSVAFAGHTFSVRVFTHENAYALDAARLKVSPAEGGLDVACTGLVWAGGQQRSAGTVTASLRTRDGAIECEAAATIDGAVKGVKAIALVVRGIPRGRLSAGGAAFFDPRDDEVLLGYPFSGGDLFGPQGNGGLTTPLVLVQPRDGGEVVSISSRDDRVRTKRLYFQPGERGYRVEALVEAEGWQPSSSFRMPAWRISRAPNAGAAIDAHYAHIERAFHLPAWDSRADVPDWLRRTALVVTLHGMHYTGYVFNDFARMQAILEWMATRMPAARVLVFLASWDGRYYWDYPIYTPAARMGGEGGFRTLVKKAQALGFRVMPMFGANAANREQPAFARVADAATSKIDGDHLELNWVDWDNDRHQEGWLSYMNLGVDSWRRWLGDRIADVVSQYGVDAYFLDIAGGWVNNTKADMHEGMRRLVGDLRKRFPNVLACGEMHYDALVEFIPLYHSFGQTLAAGAVQRHARFFQHLSHPAPGRGSSGVHESGFGRWNAQTLSLSEYAIPTLNVVDDTFDAHRDEMDAVMQEAKRRAAI